MGLGPESLDTDRPLVDGCTQLGGHPLACNSSPWGPRVQALGPDRLGTNPGSAARWASLALPVKWVKFRIK